MSVGKMESKEVKTEVCPEDGHPFVPLFSLFRPFLDLLPLLQSSHTQSYIQKSKKFQRRNDKNNNEKSRFDACIFHVLKSKISQFLLN